MTIPPAKLSPTEAIRILLNLVSITRDHAAKQAARRAELIDLLGDSDVEAVLTKNPEKLSELSPEIISLQTQLALSDSALAAARSRMAEIAPTAYVEIARLREELRGVHDDSRIFVLTRAKAKITRIVGGDAANFGALVQASPEVRDQNYFENTFPANIEIPTRFEISEGNVVTDHVADEAFDRPEVFSNCYHRLGANLKAARERLDELKAAAKREDSAQLSEVEALRKENADLRTLLALKR